MRFCIFSINSKCSIQIHIPNKKHLSHIPQFRSTLIAIISLYRQQQHFRKKPAKKEAKVEEVQQAVTNNPSELSQEQAKELVDNFENLVSSDPEKTFVCGFELNRGDIQAILEDSTGQTTDSIFFMLGANTNGDTFDVVICIENSSTSQYAYYDFTLPCPEQCPSYLATCNAPSLGDLAGNKGYYTLRSDLQTFLNEATQPQDTSYVMYQTNSWSSGLYGVVCGDDCAAPGANAPYFTPCGNSYPCHSID